MKSFDLGLCKDSERHHVELAKFHEACASCYKGLAKSGAADYFKDLQLAHENAMQSHLKMAKCFVTISEGLEDAGEDSGDGSDIPTNVHAGDELLNAVLAEDRFVQLAKSKLEPTMARGSFTTMTGPRTQSVQLIPRFGSPEVQTSTRPSVNDTDFLDLAALED